MHINISGLPAYGHQHATFLAAETAMGPLLFAHGMGAHDGQFPFKAYAKLRMQQVLSLSTL